MSMKKVDYNIEYAHIYSDESGLTDEQKKSSEVAKEVIERLREDGKSFVVTLMVDEYHPEFDRLNFEKFLKNLSDLGVKPTYIGYESKMISAAKILLDTIPMNLKEKEKFRHKVDISKKITYLKDDEGKIKLKTEGDVVHRSRYTCPILSASWSLLRLGVLQAQNAVELTGLTKPKPFAARKVINVLPEKYRSVEDTAREIISSSTEYGDFSENLKMELFGE